VDGAAGARGNVTYSVTVRVPNHAFVEAVNTARVFPIIDINVGATLEDGEPRMAPLASGSTLWYSITLPGFTFLNAEIMVRCCSHDLGRHAHPG
jgi:hypothetical protein